MQHELNEQMQAMRAIVFLVALIFVVILAGAAFILFSAYLVYIFVGLAVILAIVAAIALRIHFRNAAIPRKVAEQDDRRLELEEKNQHHTHTLAWDAHEHQKQMQREQHEQALRIQQEQHWLAQHLAMTRIPASSKEHYYIRDESGAFQALPNLNTQRQIAGPKEVEVEEDTPAGRAFAIPTGRQLLLSGAVEQALIDGKIILGPGEDGELRYIKIKRCFTTIVSGLPSVGKTTTVFWISGQLTLIGAKLWIVDPHMYFEDEDGNKSLAAELSELSDSFVFPPCDGGTKEVLMRIRWMYNQLMTRKKPGYIVRAENTVIGIMDEFNSIADSIDKKIVVVQHEGQDLNFAGTLALVEREGRKYGLHFMLIGHKWAQQDIGGDNAVRTNATTYLCHKMNDQRQADLLLSGQGKKVLALTVGYYWITGPTWNAEPAKIATPMISAADVPVLKQIRARHIQVLNLENVVEGSVASTMASTVASTWPSDIDPGRDTGRDLKSLGRPLDATNEIPQISPELQAKMIMVLEMDEQEKNQNDIISGVWGVNPDTREGRAAKEELKMIRSYLAAHSRKTMRFGVN